MTQQPSERELIGLIQGYRARMVAAGQPVKVIHALVATKGASVPAGTLLAWGCLRGYVEARQTYHPDKDKSEIIEIQPDQEIEV
jgi:hypothetical protein